MSKNKKIGFFTPTMVEFLLFKGLSIEEIKYLASLMPRKKMGQQPITNKKRIINLNEYYSPIVEDKYENPYHDNIFYTPEFYGFLAVLFIGLCCWGLYLLYVWITKSFFI
jgi:hypothetical protein